TDTNNTNTNNANANNTDTNTNNTNTNASNSNKMDIIYVTESEKLIDSLVISPLAAKKNAPVVLTSSELKDSQKDVFNQRIIKNIVRVGGEVKEHVVNSIVDLLINK
ncbi:MAG: cell wall-binding repeat-containing protein, partial [Clostridioides sp.]|nr:cell wall-binding repeat-containing protein [Clostridioides sp.]